MQKTLGLLLIASVLAVGLCSCLRLFGSYCEPGTVRHCTCPDGREFDVVCPETCNCDEVSGDAAPDCGDAAPDSGDAATDSGEPDAEIPEGCGDGIVRPPEQCDDGVNNGALDHCAVDCSAGPPARLSFIREPSDGTVGVPITPSPQVRIEDREGNRVRGASLEVTLTLASDPTGGVLNLSGNGPVAAMDGLAEFPALLFDTPGVGFVIDAESPSLATASSSPFSVRRTADWSDALAEWQYRKSILIPARSPHATLSDFPILLAFESDADLRERAQSDGFDLRFTDQDGTLLPHETDRYNAGTGALVGWVRIPTFDTSTDTMIFMYYGNPAATSDPSDVAVWSHGFVSVWHLDETGDGTEGEYLDATGNGNDATGGEGTARDVPSTTSGMIVNGQSGDGESDFIMTPLSLTGLDRLSVTLWAFVRDTSNTSHPGLVGQNDAIESGFYWPDRLNVWTADMTVDCPGKNIPSLCTADFPFEEWFHLAVSWDGSEAVMYINGVEQHRMESTVGSSSFTFTMMGQIFDRVGNNLDGVLDEVRVAATDRSRAWFAHEYVNQVDPGSYFVVGAEERSPL